MTKIVSRLLVLLCLVPLNARPEMAGSQASVPLESLQNLGELGLPGGLQDDVTLMETPGSIPVTRGRRVLVSDLAFEIPAEYGEIKRKEIVDTLNRLRALCPQCSQVDPVITNPFPITPLPGPTVPASLSEYCGVPAWLANRRAALAAYAGSTGVAIESATCERVYFSALIDALTRQTSSAEVTP